MSKTWLIFRQEIIRTMWRKSFILTLILVPLIGALVTVGASLLGQRDSGTNILTELFVPQATTSARRLCRSGGLHPKNAGRPDRSSHPL